MGTFLSLLQRPIWLKQSERGVNRGTVEPRLTFTVNEMEPLWTDDQHHLTYILKGTLLKEMKNRLRKTRVEASEQFAVYCSNLCMDWMGAGSGRVEEKGCFLDSIWRECWFIKDFCCTFKLWHHRAGRPWECRFLGKYSS